MQSTYMQNVNDDTVNLIEVYDISTVVFYYVIPLTALGLSSTAVVLRLRANSRVLTRFSSHPLSVSAPEQRSGSNKSLEASAALVRVSVVQAVLVSPQFHRLAAPYD